MAAKTLVENPEFGVFHSLAFVASTDPRAQKALKKLKEKYPSTTVEKADVVIALGGDGMMLETLHKVLGRDVPVYGMNFGSIGFLMNDYKLNGLLERLAHAHPAVLHPLKMRARDDKGRVHEALAINEVSLFRMTRQAAKIRIDVDGHERLSELICDGVMAATPAGSTAYNLSAYGPIIPIDAGVIALTAISAFRPRRWRGALLPETVRCTFTILESKKRPVSAVADHIEIRHVTKVDVEQDKSTSFTILFDDGHNIEERILREQFTP